jgi:hypothetical protein
VLCKRGGKGKAEATNYFCCCCGSTGNTFKRMTENKNRPARPAGH